LRRTGANENNTDSYEEKKKNRRDKKGDLDLQRGFPFIKKVLRSIIEKKSLLLNTSFFLCCFCFIVYR